MATSGLLAGVCNYIAPKTFAAVENESLDRVKSPYIYSFGMVQFEMLTLTKP